MKSTLTVLSYLAACLVCLLPAALALLFIRVYGVNVAVVDDFIFVNGFTQYFTGTLSPDFLVALHNGHCLFFGKILMLALGLATHFNIIAEMYLSWMFLLCTLLVLAHLVTRTLGSKLSSLLLMAPVSFLIFSLRPWDVFLNGSVFLNSMTIFFTILSIILLFHSSSEKISRSLVCAVLCGIVGTFSGSASGLIVWPVGMLQLMPLNLKDLFKQSGSRLWMVAATICIAAYGGLMLSSKHVNQHGQAGSALEAIFHHISMMPPYLFTLLGFPVCGQLNSTQICGVVVLLFYLSVAAFYFAKRPFGRHVKSVRAALAIFLFGFLAIGLITYGRSERGWLEATATRYVQFSSIMLIGAYLVVCFSEFKKPVIRNLFLVAFLGMITTTTAVGYSAAQACGTFWRNLQLKNAYLLRTYKIQTDSDLSNLQSNPFFVKFQAAALEKYKLNVFSRPGKDIDDVPKTEGAPSFCLDKTSTTDATLLRNGGTSIKLSGWAFDSNSKRPAKRLALFVDDATMVPVCYGLIYPGVAEGFHAKALSDCGFYASFSPSILNEGKHSIRLAVEASDGQSITMTKPIASVIVR